MTITDPTKSAPVGVVARAVTRVELVPIALSENGHRYRVTYAGESLVEGRRNPIFDACRALLARGITGRLEVWRRGKTSADMQLDIEKGAAVAIEESDNKSIRLRRWVPMPVPCARGEATAARQTKRPPAIPPPDETSPCAGKPDDRSLSRAFWVTATNGDLNVNGGVGYSSVVACSK